MVLAWALVHPTWLQSQSYLETKLKKIKDNFIKVNKITILTIFNTGQPLGEGRWMNDPKHALEDVIKLILIFHFLLET